MFIRTVNVWLECHILLCYCTVMYITFNTHTYMLTLPRDHNGNKNMGFLVLSFWPDVHLYAYLCTCVNKEFKSIQSINPASTNRRSYRFGFLPSWPVHTDWRLTWVNLTLGVASLPFRQTGSRRCFMNHLQSARLLTLHLLINQELNIYHSPA